MEFHEKLQELRKKRGLTQEELAGALFVSRTAVSKWESGRGYPNLDSLKAIAKYFSVTVDELLSGEEVLTIAEEDRRNAAHSVCGLAFGALDLSTAVLLFLPFFRQTVGGEFSGVPLLSLTEIAPYIRFAYFAAVFGMIVSGLAALALQKFRPVSGKQPERWVSLGINAAGVLLFILSPQPYAAALLFVFLAVKVLLFVKQKL